MNGEVPNGWFLNEIILRRTGVVVCFEHNIRMNEWGLFFFEGIVYIYNGHLTETNFLIFILIKESRDCLAY